MKDKKFKIGDSLTYKYMNDLPGGNYIHKGSCHGGCVGVLLEYHYYHDIHDCWNMEVSLPGGGSYTMCESEFVEYYIIQNSFEKELEEIRELIYKEE